MIRMTLDCVDTRLCGYNAFTVWLDI